MQKQTSGPFRRVLFFQKYYCGIALIKICDIFVAYQILLRIKTTEPLF